MDDDVSLLDIMQADARDQSALYQPGEYWSRYLNRVDRGIRLRGISGFRSDTAIGRDYAGAPALDPLALVDPNKLTTRLARWFMASPLIKSTITDRYLALVRKHFDQMHLYRSYYYEHEHADWLSELQKEYGLPQTMVGGAIDGITIRGVSISWFYIHHLARIRNFSTVVDFSKAGSAFEIGGGMAATAHLLLSMFPNITKYLYVDIPPMLYVGTQYLKHFFGDSVIDYRETRSADVIRFSSDDRREIICICPWQIERVEARLDLFWNSASFQEIALRAVQNYAAHVARLTSHDARLCLYVYGEHNAAGTLSLSEIIDAFEDRFRFEPLIAQINESPLHTLSGLPEETAYLVGTAKGIQDAADV